MSGGTEGGMSEIFRDMSFGGLLRSRRVDAGITLRKASQMVGMDAGNYSKLETSKLAPPHSRESIVNVCNKLGIEADEFLIGQAFAFHLGKLHEQFYGKGTQSDE
jgi:transcriptional regulator with XRE-family HTH domain